MKMTSKTKTIIMFVLLAVNIALAFGIYNMISGDVRERETVKKIDSQVIEKLKLIRECQLAYRNNHGKYAPTFEDLITEIRDGKIIEYKMSGDRDRDPNAEVKMDTIYKDAMIEIFGTRDYPIEKLGLVPPHDTATFILEVGQVTKNDVTLPTFQVTDPYPYNKKRTLQVGNLFDAIDAGNWK